MIRHLPIALAFISLAAIAGPYDDHYAGNDGSIHMPKSPIPPLHDGGWWHIDDLMVGHDEIRGKFRLNELNKPTIVINRRSGVMTLDSIIKFTGRCDADDGHRRF